jgi:hypothetical protein
MIYVSKNIKLYNIKSIVMEIDGKAGNQRMAAIGIAST